MGRNTQEAIGQRCWAQKTLEVLQSRRGDAGPSYTEDTGSLWSIEEPFPGAYVCPQSDSVSLVLSQCKTQYYNFLNGYSYWTPHGSAMSQKKYPMHQTLWCHLWVQSPGRGSLPMALKTTFGGAIEKISWQGRKIFWLPTPIDKISIISLFKLCVSSSSQGRCRIPGKYRITGVGQSWGRASRVLHPDVPLARGTLFWGSAGRTTWQQPWSDVKRGLLCSASYISPSPLSSASPWETTSAAK